MSDDATHRYFEIRERYWKLRDLPYSDSSTVKERSRANAALQAEFSTCVTALLDLGRAGEAEACFALGDAYAAGNGVARDSEKAIEWFTRAAETGHAQAMVRLALALEREASPETPSETIEWLKRAASLGNTSAMIFLGFAYRDGRGVTCDNEEAGRWFTRAYENGDLHSMVHVGRLLAWDAQSPEKALPWLRSAADAGFTDSYWALATICADEKSPHYNPVEAFHWYRAIANTSSSGGAARALVCIARMARDGHGTEQNLGLARTYLEMALTLQAPKEVRIEAERLLSDMNASLL